MFLASSNKWKRLLQISYIGKVEAEELQQGLEDLEKLIADLPADMRLLVDFSRLDSMAQECAAPIGSAMEMIDKHGVSVVVRVIPDSTKDIGMNVLSFFHYLQRPKVIACDNMMQAARALHL